MKALITAGGHGTRLRPITHTKNKHLIPIANRTMLSYSLKFAAEAGITEAGIIINQGDTEIEGEFGSGSDLGLKITYIPQEAPLGLAHVVKIAQPFIGDENFIFYLGDNILVGGIRKFIDEFESNGSNCHLVLSKVSDPERFGVPEIEGDKIIGVEEKPTEPKSSFAVTGIYLYDSSIFEAVNNIEPSARGELEISDAHQYLLDNGRNVTFSEITGWWKDTGKASDLLEANRLVLDNLQEERNGTVENSNVTGRVSIGEGSKVIGSTIRGPAILGKDVIVENAYIGPHTAIADGCRIIGSELEYSILMERTSIIDVQTRIESSLIGYDAEVIRGSAKPKSHRLLIGDQSRIQIS